MPSSAATPGAAPNVTATVTAHDSASATEAPNSTFASQGLVQHAPAAGAPLSSAWRFLREELAPFPGRAVGMVRIVLGVCLTCFLILLFDLPGMDIAAYVPLFAYRRDRAESIKLGLVFGVLAFASVGTTLPLWELTEGRWALRFMVLAAVTFVTLDAMLIPKVGTGIYAIGTLTVMFLTFTDLAPHGGIVTTELLKAATSVAIAGLSLALVSAVPFGPTPAVGPESEEAETLPPQDVRARFAARGTIAVMLGFVLYTSTDWFGIHTCMYTTLFIASTDRVHRLRKGMLRIGGATVGSIAAVALMVWVLPRLDGVAGFLAVVAAVTAVSGWVAAGSERISYAGMQIGLAFYLAALITNGPLNELNETRDRILGVLFGVVLAWFAFSPGTLGLDERRS